MSLLFVSISLPPSVVKVELIGMPFSKSPLSKPKLDEKVRLQIARPIRLAVRRGDRQEGLPVSLLLFDNLSNLDFNKSAVLHGHSFSSGHSSSYEATTAQWLEPSGSTFPTIYNREVVLSLLTFTLPNLPCPPPISWTARGSFRTTPTLWVLTKELRVSKIFGDNGGNRSTTDTNPLDIFGGTVVGFAASVAWVA